MTTGKTLRSWASGRSRREVTRRAAADLERGLVDTDRRGKPVPAPKRRKK